SGVRCGACKLVAAPSALVLSNYSNRSIHRFFFFLILPPPPRSTLFPYTTLFRSVFSQGDTGIQAEARVNKPRARAQGPAKAQKSAFSSSIPRKPAEEEKFLWQRQRQSDRGKQIGRARRQLKQRSEEHTSELQSRSDLVC